MVRPKIFAILWGEILLLNLLHQIQMAVLAWPYSFAVLPKHSVITMSITLAAIKAMKVENSVIV